MQRQPKDGGAVRNPLSQAWARWRLGVELGVGSEQGTTPGMWLGLLLAAVIGVVAGGAMLWMNGGAYGMYRMPVYGRVEGLSMGESDLGSYPVLRVQVGGNLISVTAPPGASCLVGDRVRLYAAPGLLGKRFRFAGPDACARVE